MTQTCVKVLWRVSPGAEPKVKAAHGQVKAVASTDQHHCQQIVLGDVNTQLGAYGTRVSIETPACRFTFLLRDVTLTCPIVIPSYGVAVTAETDTRTYAQIESQVLTANAGLAGLSQMDREPEESYENAASAVRDARSPVVLGLSRDMRTFEVDWLDDFGFWGVIRPKLPWKSIELPGLPEYEQAEYSFIVGRGVSCVEHVTRRLEDGCLPIIHSQTQDGDIDWKLTLFADLEKTPLSAQTLRGTDYLVADHYAFGPSHSEAQKERVKQLDDAEYRGLPELTLLCIKLVASNTTSQPSYAWFKAPSLFPYRSSGMSESDIYTSTPGLGRLEDGRVICVAKLNGRPLPQLENAILLQPGEQAVIELYVPHQPVNEARATDLLACHAGTFEERHQRCRAFWQAKLDRVAQVHLPEQRVEEMVRAGLLHLDMISYGKEPSEPVAAMVGRYTPIGTESAPIIQFYDAMGWHDLARRSLDYFFEKQRDTGQMQNYQYYQSETGPVLWTAGEHYRYTRDLDWVRSLADKLVHASEFLMAWRRRNLDESLRGVGYGMHDGAVADPKEPTHYFMNAGYTCLGLSRVAEMLDAIGDSRADAIRAESQAMKQDVLESLDDALARGPVVPLGDGTWAPTCGPFPESTGALALLVDRHIAVSHSSFVIHDSAIGALYLLLQEVLDPRDDRATFLVATNHRLNTVRNVAPSQPYYCRHDYAHLKRGEVKAFLKCFYNTLASQADREVYTFWEHQYRAGVHKTHEEGWFLMQVRWMLLMEEGQELHLLRGVPRQWLDGGRPLGFENLASYFGPVSLSVTRDAQQGVISATLSGASRSLPGKVSIRLPHPQQAKAVSCEGGHYDAATETVTLDSYTGQATVTLRFA